MPNPTLRDMHVDAPLTNLSVAYIQQASSFVADKVFPVVPVQKQSDRYFVYSRDDWYRNEAQVRVPGTESAGGGYRIDNTPTYYAEVYAYHKDVTEADRQNADSAIRPDQDAVEYATQKLLLRRETVWASRYFTTGVWATEKTGVAATPGANQFLQWDQANSTPIDDLSNAIVDIGGKTGYRPNVLVLGARVYQELRNHPTFVDRIKYTQRGVVTEDLIAAILGVDKVVVAWGVANSAPEGAAGSYDFVLGKHALLAYAAPNPGLKTPSAGYIFAWTGLEGAGAFGARVSRFPLPWLGQGTERIEGEMAFDAKVVASDLGAFFANAVA